jgi:hypothetical protein
MKNNEFPIMFCVTMVCLTIIIVAAMLTGNLEKLP